MAGHLFSLILVILFLFSTKVYSAASDDSKALFAKYKHAVFKIIVKQQGLPDSFGTGFLISDTGEAVTNFHVLKNAVELGGYTAEFKMFNGQTIRDFSVAQCSDSRDLDLCIIKLAVKPISHFKWALERPETGQKIFVIGHPQGLDFSMSDGIVSGVRNNDNKIGFVQITAPISPGNSGGPIFTSDGSVVGVATSFMDRGQNLNLEVIASEGRGLQMSQKSFQNSAQYKVNMITKIKNLSSHMRATQIDPTIQLLKERKPIAERGEFSEQLLMLPGMNFAFSVYLPKTMLGCQKQEDKLVCSDLKEKRYFCF